MKSSAILFPSFSVDCYDGEVLDDQLCRYRIALAVHGIGADQISTAVYEPLVEGSILHNLKIDQFTVDADRPLLHPATMSESDAGMVLLAVFRRLDLCRGHEDGFVISIPTVLQDWTRESLPPAVAFDTERVLLAAVMLNNSEFN